MSPQAPFLAPERDSAFKEGRAKAGGTTYYTIPGAHLRSAGTVALNANTDYYSPFWIRTPILVDQLALNMTTAVSGNCRFGLYAADTDLQPVGAPLADSGDIAASAAVLTYTPGTPLYLPRGRYLTVYNQAQANTVREFFGSESPVPLSSSIGASPFQTQWSVSRTYAAFPTPGTAWNTVSSVSSGAMEFFVVLRISQP